MAIVQVSSQAPYYTAQSTDIVDNKIAGANYVGTPVYITDTKSWYIINPDLTLSPLNYNVVVQVGGNDVSTTNPVPCSVIGSLPNQTLVEQKTNSQAVSNVLTFSANINAIEIYHESTIWQAFTVNGITLNIPSGGYRTPIGGTPGTTVTIPAGLSCIVGRLV